MNLKKKITAFLFTAVYIVTLFPAISANALSFTPFYYNEDGKAQDLELYSKCAYMINVDTGEVMVDINSDEERVPASLTKIMTAVVLLDEFEGDENKLKNTYYSSGTEAFDELYGTGASTADIQPYEEVSCYDLLAALLIPSACEAANIIALNMCDTIKDFTLLMNEKAEELGMSGTHFSNAHGLSGTNNYSTCKDMAVLCQYALDTYPVFEEIVSMSSYTMSPTDYHSDGTTIYNTNLALNQTSDYYYSPMKGIKTGSLDKAGRCLASYATYDGTTYLTVTMGAPMTKLAEDEKKGEEDPDSIYGATNVYYNILDHIRLYKWAFSSIVSTDFIDPNSEIRDVKVEYGAKGDYANLKPANGYTRSWPVNISVDQVEKKITVYDNIVAPIEKGDVLGKMELIYNGEVLTTIDLVSATKVERSQVKAKIKIAKSYCSSTEFKVTVAIIIVGIVIYTAIHIVKMQKKYLRK
ncbi:MAG: D-alanyl-D-alanine carboxypeptidase family protein [Hominimerdicola sp.]